ncbi:pleckstrin homology domain-containing family O member 2-like [Conger conger]|uniref:pleckstrin homology domain-containing family O member 2-like n=1 Tax=Conger conger TaxID=82655 RepID=UPI002A59C2DC|nr:pleckstrin homology domain-containing family O member 2-like [Conger conger]
MEDGVKGTTPSFTGKAGWVKKSSGKLLGSYKERYIKVEKTEMVVFENQELQTCLERVDLEKYDKCLDLRSTFKKKNRLVLIRAHKQGSKVHDVKLQVENAEEKEVWIKALNDAINRAKNKIFDEVKVDESCSLDHVTRSRPRGTQSRRPPSRIHMKEVASSSCDGIVRLDLDPVEHTPNGTHELNAATVEVSDKKSEPIAKPPMPPSQPSEDLQDTPSEERMANPTPPLKESKPKVLGEGDTSAGTTTDSSSEPVVPEKRTGTEDREEDYPFELPSEPQLSTTSEQVMGRDGLNPTPYDTPVIAPVDPTPSDTPISPPVDPTASDIPISPPVDMPTSPVLQQDESGQPTPEREHSEHKVLSEQEVVSPVLNAEPPASYRTEVQFVIGPVQLLVSKPAEYAQETSPDLLPESVPEPSPESLPQPSPEPAPECPPQPSAEPAPESTGLPAPSNMKSLKVLDVSDHSGGHWEGSAHDPASSRESITPLDDGMSGRLVTELRTELHNERLGCLSEESGSSPSTGQEDSGQKSHTVTDSCPSLEKDWAGRPPLSIPTPVGELLSAGEEQQPDVDELRSRVAHELQTTQELLGEVCQEEARGPVPEDLLIKAAEKLQLAQLCLREASTLKLCQPSSRKDKRISW